MTVRFEPESRELFYQDEWKTFWDGLTEAQKQSLRDKAAWEHMTLSAVAMEWGAKG